MWEDVEEREGETGIELGPGGWRESADVLILRLAAALVLDDDDDDDGAIPLTSPGP